MSKFLNFKSLLLIVMNLNRKKCSHRWNKINYVSINVSSRSLKKNKNIIIES